jgi:hypothetical protein
MTRRARNPRPYELLDLNFNPKTNLYEKTEAGITYGMPLELTRQIKNYFRYFPLPSHGGLFRGPSLAKWYDDLQKDLKKQVVRTGDVPQKSDDFVADPEYPD